VKTLDTCLNKFLSLKVKVPHNITKQVILKTIDKKQTQTVQFLFVGHSICKTIALNDIWGEKWLHDKRQPVLMCSLLQDIQILIFPKVGLEIAELP